MAWERDIDSAWVVTSASTARLTHPSTSLSCEEVRGSAYVKSNRRQSALQQLPAWIALGPITSLRAACNRCVAVWCADVRRLRRASTTASTLVPARRADDMRFHAVSMFS